jgi:hypothetical protein
MNTLLFIFLIWLPISSIFYSLVSQQQGEVTNIGKKILLWVLTAPSIWFFELNKLVAKFAGKFTFLSKAASWFKS